MPYEPPGYRKSYAPQVGTAWPLVLSIVATLFCCQPVGVVAIVFAVLAMVKNKEGEREQAARYVRISRTFSGIAVALFIVVIVIGALTGALPGMSGGSAPMVPVAP